MLNYANYTEAGWVVDLLKFAPDSRYCDQKLYDHAVTLLDDAATREEYLREMQAFQLHDAAMLVKHEKRGEYALNWLYSKVDDGKEYDYFHSFLREFCQQTPLAFLYIEDAWHYPSLYSYYSGLRPDYVHPLDELAEELVGNDEEKTQALQDWTRRFVRALVFDGLNTSDYAAWPPCDGVEFEALRRFGLAIESTSISRVKDFLRDKTDEYPWEP